MFIVNRRKEPFSIEPIKKISSEFFSQKLSEHTKKKESQTSVYRLHFSITCEHSKQTINDPRVITVFFFLFLVLIAHLNKFVTLPENSMTKYDDKVLSVTH